ncbi:MAG: tetratricopeptide repeat protein [Acidobacteria bacterium]|nr:tetratricopeptide repeat protein [Acidobacteriota bacterium]
MKKLITVTGLLLLLGSMATGQEKLKHAVDLYRAGNYSDAVAELEKFGAGGHGTHQSLLYLGAAYQHLGDKTKARDGFKRAQLLAAVANIDGETPLKITAKPKPDARQVPGTYRNGSATIAVEFKSDGTLGFVFLVKGNPDEFTQACIDAAKGITFEPSTAGGKPVTVIKLVEYSLDRY